MTQSDIKTQRQLPMGLIYLLFFFSGMSSLIFETIFTRLLTYTFGNTAQAVSIVLAAFLGGLALGAYILGHLVDHWPPSAWSYGTLELVAGIVCLFIPTTFALLTELYVALYHRFGLGSTSLTLVQFGLSVTVILLPTIVMGGTFPAMAHYVAAICTEHERVIDVLYAANTLGAAFGTIASTYIFMPILGIQATVRLACGIDFLIFTVIVLYFPRRLATVARDQTACVPAATVGLEIGAGGAWLLALSAFLTGAIALGYEVVWTHALSFLVGNTVYAFGSMLFVFMCGLGFGARAVSRLLRNQRLWGAALASSQILLALCVFITVPLWSFITVAFAQGIKRTLEYEFLLLGTGLIARMGYGVWSIYRQSFDDRRVLPRVIELAAECLIIGFLILFVSLRSKLAYYFPSELAELARFLSVLCLLIAPCFLLGLSFPLLLNLSSHSAIGVGRRIGVIYAVNTVGAIVGSIGMGFVLLPRFGSLNAIRVCATFNMALGLLFSLWLVPLNRTRKVALIFVTCSLPIILWAGLGNWDPRRLMTGSYVYFQKGASFDRILYSQEDVQGGLTSIVQNGGVRTLLSNGKFQGNNAGQVQAQIRFAMIPVLFTEKFDRALVIGLGTGNTLRALTRFPFRSIEAAEIAPHVIDAARLWFQDVNDDVFDRDERVKLHTADGRNFLLLSKQRYDLITVEITSIWISGEADLYNKEFYTLCRSHLTNQGVLQQWIQLHHMPMKTLVVILNTVAQIFPHVGIFIGPDDQAILVASVHPLQLDFVQIDGFDKDPGVSQDLKSLQLPSMFSLLSEMTLYGSSFSAAVSQLLHLSGLPADFVSTDWRPFLEYETPKGNFLSYNTVPINIAFFNKFRAELPGLETLIQNMHSESDKNLVLGYVAESRGDPVAAVQFFEGVEGASRDRAQLEISRMESFLHHASR